MSRLVIVVLFLSLGGCSGMLPVRIDGPAGATMRIEGRHEQSGQPQRMPFTADFEVGRSYSPYQVIIEIPASLSQQYGGRGAVRLFGELYIHPPTQLVGSGVVTLHEDREAIASLIQGNVGEVWWEVNDPSQRQTVVRIVLRAAPR